MPRTPRAALRHLALLVCICITASDGGRVSRPQPRHPTEAGAPRLRVHTSARSGAVCGAMDRGRAPDAREMGTPYLPMKRLKSARPWRAHAPRAATRLDLTRRTAASRGAAQVAASLQQTPPSGGGSSVPLRSLPGASPAFPPRGV